MWVEAEKLGSKPQLPINVFQSIRMYWHLCSSIFNWGIDLTMHFGTAKSALATVPDWV